MKCFSISFCIVDDIATPGRSKRRICTARDRSSGADVECEVVALRLQRCLPSGAGNVRGSATCTPVELSPEISALDHAVRRRALAARDDACAAAQSRPIAAPKRTASSGVRSTLTSPSTPSCRRRASWRDSQIRLSWICAVLDLLVRVDANAGEDHRLVAEVNLVADRNALVHTRVRLDVAVAADDGALNDGAAADVRRRVDHRSRDAAALAQRRQSEHRVRPD